MASIFTQIINRQLPAHIIAENEYCIAFLDIHPLAQGHTLVVPKLEVDYIFDLADTILSQIFPFAKKVAKGIQEVIPCARIGMAVLGLDVPHAHLHLIPLNKASDINFSREPLSYTQEELARIAQSIRLHIPA
ncbi:MAG: HIT family protein [Candidatus Amoebophilus sp.]